jgi:hypothetical protein
MLLSSGRLSLRVEEELFHFGRPVIDDRYQSQGQSRALLIKRWLRCKHGAFRISALYSWPFMLRSVFPTQPRNPIWKDLVARISKGSDCLRNAVR